MEAISFDQIGRTRRLDVITLLSSMGVFMDGYALSIFSTAYLYLRESFLGEVILVSLGASSIYMGMFAGSLILGRLSDSFGRKKLYTYDLLLTAIFLALSGFSRSFETFFIFQFLAGIGIGADYPISSSIQAEFSPRRTRGRYLVFNIFSWTIGSLAFYAVSIPLVILGGQTAWRLMYVTAAAVPILVIVGRRSLPESPYWLIKKGRKQDAEKVVEVFAQEAGIGEARPPSVEEGKTSLSSLRKYIPLLIFTSVSWFAYDVSSYGVWNYTPSLFSGTGSSYLVTVLATMLEEIPVVAGTLICLYSVDLVGRRKLETIGFGLAGVSLVLFSVLSFHMAFPFAMMFAAFAMMHFFHNIGPTNITYLYPVEIFPTRIRATAMGISTAASRIGAILGVFAFPLLLQYLNLSFGLIFFAAFEFLGLVVTIILAPETKNRSLA